jgi:hypothetical protein
VEYLGHIVGKDGVRLDPKKNDSMQDWHHPKTLNILRGFMCLIGYYRKFLKNYQKIEAPLIDILKNNAFTWTPTVDQSFHALKEALCMKLVLELVYFSKTFILECDASRKGIGAVLMQDGRPFAFTRKELSDRHLD